MQKLTNLVLGLAVCGSMMTIAQAAQAAIINLSANLTQDQEVYPPGSNPTIVPGAAGFAEMTYDTDTNIFGWNILFENLSGPLTNAHQKIGFEASPFQGDLMPLIFQRQ